MKKKLCISEKNSIALNCIQIIKNCKNYLRNMDEKDRKNTNDIMDEKDHKSPEDIKISLRNELQLLYESLKDKNQELISLEKDIKDRDMTIKYLRAEYRKLKASTCSEPSLDECTNCLKKIKPTEVNSVQEEQPEELLLKLQRELKDRESTIKEMNRKIVRLSDNLIFVQKESLSKDDTIEELKLQVDKFRHVVKSQISF